MPMTSDGLSLIRLSLMLMFRDSSSLARTGRLRPRSSQSGQARFSLRLVDSGSPTSVQRTGSSSTPLSLCESHLTGTQALSPSQRKPAPSLVIRLLHSMAILTRPSSYWKTTSLHEHRSKSSSVVSLRRFAVVSTLSLRTPRQRLDLSMGMAESSLMSCRNRSLRSSAPMAILKLSMSRASASCSTKH